MNQIKPKTILFILDDFHIGGTTSTIKEYASIIHTVGWQSTIIGLSGNMKDYLSFFPHSDCVCLPYQPGSSTIKRLWQSIYYFRALSEIYRSNNVQIVHFSSVWSTLYCFLHPITWFTCRVYTAHGIYALERKSQRANGVRETVKFFFRLHLQGLFMLWSHSITTFSAYSERLIRSVYPYLHKKIIHIIPGLVPTSSLKSGKTEMRPKHTDKLRILFIGRAEPRKGLGLLLKAVSILKEKSMPYSLTIASPVEYYYWFNILYTYQSLNLFTSVHFLHASNNTQRQTLIKNSDVLIVPSLDLEIFGISIIEGLAAGLPVIGAATGAIPEILEKVDPRLLFNISDPAHLADKIIWFRNLSSLEKHRLSARGIKTVKKYYRTETFARQLIGIYKSMLY